MRSSALLLVALVIYTGLHSLLATHRAKDFVRRVVGVLADRYYRLVYNLVAVLTFLPILAILIMNPGRLLYRITQPWLVLMILGQALSIVVMVIGFLHSDPLHFFGLRQLLNRDEKPGVLTIHGLYRWVRHPLYTVGLTFIWLTPIMTVNLLALIVVLSIYLVIGSIFEEQRLIAEFGQPYRDYQRQVPRLFPLPRRKYQG
jgi:protein-S-isoprenylcysteine O-methyltransferase Ste14